MDTRDLAKLQRDYDRYRERHDLPLTSVRDIGWGEFDAFAREHQELFQAYIANQRAQEALIGAIGRAFHAADTALGPDPSRTTADVATPEQVARFQELAGEEQRLARTLGLAVTTGVREDGEVWMAVPRAHHREGE